MRALSVSLLMILLISCGGKTKVRQGRVITEYLRNKRFTIWGIGAGSNKQEALMRARVFLAEQKDGVRFLVTRKTIAMKTKKTVLKGTTPLFFKKLADGRIYTMIKAKNNLHSTDWHIFRTIEIPVSTMALIDNREDLYTAIIKSAYSKPLKQGEKVYGALFIRKITGLSEAGKIPKTVKIKIMFVN